LAAIVGGFAEAALLVLVARIAFALTSAGSAVTIRIGPLPEVSVSVTVLIIVAAALVAVRAALQAAQVVLSARATYATVGRTRRTLIHLYLGAVWPLQASQREGRLQELLTTYATETSNAIASLAAVAVAIFSLTALLATALAVNAVASIAAGLAALLIGLMLRPLRAAARRRSGRAAEAQLAFATSLTELATTLQEVRVFEVEQQVAKRLDTFSDRATDRSRQTAYVRDSIGVLYQGVATLLIVLGLGVANAVGSARLASLGAIVLIMLRSLTYAQGVQNQIVTLSATAPYLETLLEEEQKYRASAAPRDGLGIHQIGQISFDDVTFEYVPLQPVLRNVSFQADTGEIIGIVGPSGAGKTTLVQLLLRLREPTKGSVRADGRDVRTLSLDDWYSRVAFVPQDAHLFAGTIADNIRFFRDDVDQVAIQRAAKRAHLDEEVAAWPLGYDTPVGERGGQLSGGQRQRLCIARALVENPDRERLFALLEDIAGSAHSAGARPEAESFAIHSRTARWSIAAIGRSPNVGRT